jgi:DNA polymerase IV
VRPSIVANAVLRFFASMSEPLRKIIHIDMDAFYASVEQRDRPELKGKPVAVGSPRARGVVAAASYEARKFGVRSAMASTTALRKCPELIFVTPRFEVYRGVSRQIRSIFLEYTPLVEPLSLDEAYLDVTANLKHLPSASDTAREIRQRIFDWTGLTASAGVSYNKFLAKLASDYKKPNGQFVVTPALGPGFVESLPVAKFHGVGPVTAEKMNKLGIQTGADLKRQTIEFLTRHFGKSGPWYYDIARGIDDRPVEPDRPRKSSGSEITLLVDLTDPAAVEKEVLGQADEVWTWCEKTRTYGHTVTVKIKYADFRQITRARTLTKAVTAQADLNEIALALTRSVYPLENGVRLVGVTVSHFPAEEDDETDQLDLDFGGS